MENTLESNSLIAPMASTESLNDSIFEDLRVKSNTNRLEDIIS